MKIRKKKTAIVLIIIFMALIVWAVFSLNKQEIVENELIIVDLESNQIIESPLIITGRAKGFWFFEGDFPIKLLDGNDKVVGIAVAQAQGEWMTEDFVEFKAVLEFSVETETGVLVLEKDNPSGLPENVDELRIPIRFNKVSPENIEASKGNVLLNVPFILQAPFANWDNPVFQDACEEAAILMVKYWLLGKDITKQEAYDEIITLAEFEVERYNNFYDHSAEDTAKIMREYIGYDDIFVEDNIDIDDIKKELDKGNLVVVPINGQAINNPNYTAPGPERHMIVIIGYDGEEIITNDSGTRLGENYTYSESVFEWAIRDYPTGHKEPIIGVRKSMIVIELNL